MTIDQAIAVYLTQSLNPARGPRNEEAYQKAWRIIQRHARYTLDTDEQSPPSAPWDAWHNRSYEPVEARATEIYNGYLAPLGGKPDWVPHGNSTMQDMARNQARKELNIAGHKPRS